MKYLTLEEILYLHDSIILKTGGREGVRDFSLLYSAIERPKASFAGKDLYKDVFSKAAALVHSLVLNHPFVDGNKRTAIASLIRFLKVNNLNLQASQKELVDFVLAIESKKMGVEGIVSYLKKSLTIKK